MKMPKSRAGLRTRLRAYFGLDRSEMYAPNPTFEGGNICEMMDHFTGNTADTLHYIARCSVEKKALPPAAIGMHAEMLEMAIAKVVEQLLEVPVNA